MILIKFNYFKKKFQFPKPAYLWVSFPTSNLKTFSHNKGRKCKALDNSLSSWGFLDGDYSPLSCIARQPEPYTHPDMFLHSFLSAGLQVDLPSSTLDSSLPIFFLWFSWSIFWYGVVMSAPVRQHIHTLFHQALNTELYVANEELCGHINLLSLHHIRNIYPTQKVSTELLWTYWDVHTQRFTLPGPAGNSSSSDC